ncbi:MAG: YqaJ viral recombinase family protein [Myxococcales bacterium]|nr:YqaJ viral recombinase family protein [Myxococcales bacterium]
MSDLHALEDALAREEWLAWRRHGLGGSDMAIIMGCARWGSLWTLWLDKRKGLTSRADTGAQMTGKLLEEAVIQWAVVETGAVGRMKAEPMQHSDHEWMRGTPDAWLMGRDGSTGLEAKVAEWPWETPPDYYLAQCRWYMAIADVDEWLLAAFFRKAPAWKLYRIERDLELEAEMIGAAGEFWSRYVIGNEIPPIDDSAAAGKGLGVIHGPPAERDLFKVATENEELMVRTYADFGSAIDTLEAERALMGNHLRDAIGKNSGLRWTGGRCRWSRSDKQPRGRLTVRIDEEER